MNIKKEAVTDVLKHLILTGLEHSDEYAEMEVVKLRNNVSNIYYNKNISKSYQELYIMVENLCTLNLHEDIYGDLSVLISEFLNLQLIDLSCYEDAYFLYKLKDLWLMYCHKSKLIKNVYLYLEMYSFKQRRRKLFIWQMCLDMFSNIILSNETIKSKLNVIYNLIETDRNGSEVDVKLITDLITMLDKLGLYESYFEKDFLLKSEEYYVIQRDILLESNILEFFYYVQTKLSEEENRIQQYLKQSTESKIITILYKVLIEDKLDISIAKLEADNIFERSDLSDIIIIYDLLVILPKANNDLCKIFSNYMMSKGSELVFDVKNENNLIAKLLEFKDRIDEIILACFKNNNLYVEAVRTCFKKFVNQRKAKPAQFLAKFIDIKMRDKLIPEDLLDKIMVLFRYIQGKDVFEAYYKRYLSKRLLLGKSSSQDAEKYMISKLKLECGDGFTSKLEGMFRDIDLSDNLTVAFKQKYASNGHLIEFSANVLTSSFWPTFTRPTVTLSDNMLNYQVIFQDFYKAKYSGRSLQWLPGLGSCLVKAELKNGNKEFQVSLFQASVMLLFNENNELTYKTIRLYLNLEDSELLRTILSLVRGKTKLLIKSPPGMEVKDTDVFSVNENFNNKLFRIKINELQYKETDEEQKITEEEVMHDRHLQIDAALVRLMKQNQKLRHNDLISKMYKVLKFPVNPNDIKKRIEILIERDFLARNPDDSNAYYYVA